MAWHPTETGNHQGLIICDETGANIAVAYDKAHAPLIASAPEAIDLIHAARELIQRYGEEHRYTLESERLAFLADSESLLAEKAGQRPRYR